MRLAYFIARRYFLSKKKKSFINVISIISMLVVAIATMALVIVLSVFNGLEGLLRNLYGSVDPNLLITPIEGKSFAHDQDMVDKLMALEGVDGITEILEDNALVKYNNAQRVVTVKGVSEDFIHQGRLEDYIVYGDLKLKEDNIPYAIVGRGVQYDLSINPKNDFYALQIYFPDKIRPGITDPTKMYRIKNILPSGVFAIEKSYDENLVYVPLDFAESLFKKKGFRSALEIQINDDFDAKKVKDDVASISGEQYEVKSNEEIHGSLYRILKYEKFFVFLAFSVIIAIASVNIFFALSMLAIDKRKDIAILFSQGASRALIRNIFLLEGCIVAFIGAFTGLILSLSICFLQQQSGLVTMGMQTAIMDAYPVKIQWLDILFTLLSIIIITIMMAIQPAIRASRQEVVDNL